jgi:hypothetical protein
MATTHDARRKVRAAEAKRDALLVKKENVVKELAKARLELAHVKKAK